MIEILTLIVGIVEGFLLPIPVDAFILVSVYYAQKNPIELIMFGLIGNLIGFLLGYVLGINGKLLLLKNYQKEFPKNTKNLSLIGLLISALSPTLPFCYFSIISGFVRVDFVKAFIGVVIARSVRLITTVIVLPNSFNLGFWEDVFLKFIKTN